MWIILCGGESTERHAHSTFPEKWSRSFHCYPNEWSWCFYCNFFLPVKPSLGPNNKTQIKNIYKVNFSHFIIAPVASQTVTLHIIQCTYHCALGCDVQHRSTASLRKLSFPLWTFINTRSLYGSCKWHYDHSDKCNCGSIEATHPWWTSLLTYTQTLMDTRYRRTGGWSLRWGQHLISDYTHTHIYTHRLAAVSCLATHVLEMSHSFNMRQ